MHLVFEAAGLSKFLICIRKMEKERNWCPLVDDLRTALIEGT